MKYVAWLLVLAVALTALNAPVQARPEKERKGDKRAAKERKGDKGAKSDSPGEYAVMAKVLNFTDAQKAELVETLKACAADARGRQEINARRLAWLNEKLAEAKKNKNEDAMTEILEKFKALRAEEAKARDVATAVVMEILTPEQKRQWAGYNVYRQIIPRFKRIVLTDEQDKKVRDMCTAKAKDIPAADAKARAEAYEALTAAIIESVLTAEQKETITGKSSRKDRKGDKGAESGLRGEYAVMARALNFTDAQKVELAETLKARAEEARKWQKDNADKIAEFRKQLIEARKNKDSGALKRISEQYKALKAGEPRSRGITAAVELLTPEQKQQWAGYTVYRQFIASRSFRRLELTDEQDKKVRDMCTVKAKDILAGDRKAQAEARKSLMTAIVDNVLTAEQKAGMKGVKLKKEPGDKPKKKLHKEGKKTGGALGATA